MGLTWERLRGEPERAYALFDQYLTLGPTRSLPKLARTTSRAVSYLRKLSARWQWQQRAAAWQQHLIASSQPPQEQAAEQLRARQLKDAQALQQLARAQIMRWVRRDPEGKVWLARQLTPHQVAGFWQTGFHVEQELLPLPPDDGPPPIKSPPEEADRSDAGAPKPPPSLRDALKRLARALRKAGLQGETVYERLAKVCRWLWLPEEEADAIRPARRSKASSNRKRERHAG